MKGYEVGKGQFVVVTDEELESVAVERRRTIDIISFIDIEEVDRARRRSPLFRFAGAERKAANAYRLCEVVARKRAANFEDAYARMLALEIGLQRRNEPGQERRSHDVEMRCDRIQHRDRCCAAGAARAAAR